MNREKGTTLVEVLVTMGVFALLMGILCSIFTEGFNMYKKGTVDVHTFQYAVLALEKMSRELQETTTTELYYPERDELMMPNSSKGIVFVRESPDGTKHEVIGYFRDDNTNEILRVLYDPGYDPAVPGTQKAQPGMKKALARNILNLYFQAEENGLIAIDMVVEGDRICKYLRTKLRNEALIR